MSEKLDVIILNYYNAANKNIIYFILRNFKPHTAIRIIIQIKDDMIIIFTIYNS